MAAGWPFVGRDDEVRRLTAGLSLAAEGQGGVVFLTGQPGIGKTRLARETLAVARARGFAVLEGRALPLQGELAYSPILNAFSPLLRSLDPEHLAILVDGLPDLGRLFGDLRLPLSSAPEGLGDPAIEKTRLFEAVSRLFERLTQESSVVLFIDDIHWADPATLDLLHYLARGLADHRALLLATYNEDSSNPSLGLQTLVGSLDRDGLAEEIVVPRLGSEAVDELVQGILGGKPPENLLDLLDARAGGTPLFVEALIAALIDSGHLVRRPAPSEAEKNEWVFDAEGATSLPPSVRRLILRRLRRLDQADRRVLDLIAIMGDAASHAALRTASGLEEECLIGSLRRLRSMGLVAEGVAGLDVAYSITHPLIQEVVYAELPEIERRRAHLAVIKALESSSGGRLDDVNRLARHYQGAGSEADPGRAISTLIAAGDRALSLYANEEAAQHYSTAVAMLREGRGLRVEGGVLPGKDPSYPQPSTLPSLLERLGEALERTGKRVAAVDVWNQALALLSAGGRDASSPESTVAAARLRCQLAPAEWDRGRFDMARAHLAAGLVLLGEGPASRKPCLELADLLFARFEILSRVRDAAGMAETAAELLSVAGRLGSPRAEAEANLVASISCIWQNDTASAREHALRALTLAESSGDGQDLAIICRAHGMLMVIGIRLGDHHSMRDHAERSLAVARRLGTPNMEVLIRSRLAYANFLAGAWQESLRNSMEAIALARRLGQPRDLAYSMAGRALVLALQGNSSEAEARISEVRAAYGGPSREGPIDRYVFGLTDVVETILALQSGQAKRALAIAGGFVPASRVEGRGYRVEGTPQPYTLYPPPSGLTPSYIPLGLMLLAEAQVAAEDPRGALETARRLSDLGPPDMPYLIALASRAEGLARQALGQKESAGACLDRAHEAFAALAMPFEAARCMLECATLTAAERPEMAARAAQQSLGTFEGLDARPYAERARQLLRGLGLPLLAARRPRSNGVSVSARELEIARLVAEGLTTAQIARRLVLSRFTVNNHLRHAYARLGISSRTALARLVIEAGLLPPREEND